MRRRISFWESIGFIVVAASAPLTAQSTNQTIPAPVPAPAGDTVGPPQLRDFNLRGTVTRPAQPDTPTPRPAPRAAPPSASPETQPAPVRTVPILRQPGITSRDSDPAPSEVAVAPPPSATVPIELDAPLAPPPQPDPARVKGTLSVADQPEIAWWPWLAVLFAASLGALFLWWRRHRSSDEVYGADHDIPPARAQVPDATATPLARAVPESSRAAPRSVEPVAPAPDSPPLPPVALKSDGIFASSLKPELAFELEPIRADAAAEGAVLTFDLIVINRGSAPARDVLIEAQLINAGPQVDAAVGRFFNQPGGNGERMPMIAPMSRVSIRTRLGAAAADLAPLVVEGRNLFVPVVAINAHYRWNGGEIKESSSFLVGRGETEGGKMAPFRLDRGARSWSGLAARLHSSGLAR